jgi:3',5'-cyclic AMP phosphodiesterase CpdA
MKLGHISDLHVLKIERPRPWEYFNKRLLGGTNLLMKRSKSHSSKVVRSALEHLQEQCQVDHIAITGDLSNLALPSEFNESARILASIPDASRRVSVIPGNHDYYTYEAARTGRFEHFFAPYIRSDLPGYDTDSGYPYCHLRGDDVAIIGMNSAIPTPWLFATGKVDAEQLDALGQMLDDPQVRPRFKVVMIHHHLLPFEHSRIEYSRRLINARKVLETLRRRDVDLAIHGHNHHFATLELPHLRGTGTLRICEAGSTSVGSYTNPYFGGKFNVYQIEDARLKSIETHLFESYDVGFKKWKEQVFEQRIQA